jgi:hypothetical protein
MLFTFLFLLRHPQQLMDRKLAKLNLEVINSKFYSKFKQKLSCFHGNSVVPPFSSPAGIPQKTLRKK